MAYQSPITRYFHPQPAAPIQCPKDGVESKGNEAVKKVERYDMATNSETSSTSSLTPHTPAPGGSGSAQSGSLLVHAHAEKFVAQPVQSTPCSRCWSFSCRCSHRVETSGTAPQAPTDTSSAMLVVGECPGDKRKRETEESDGDSREPARDRERSRAAFQRTVAAIPGLHRMARGASVPPAQRCAEPYSR